MRNLLVCHYMKNPNEVFYCVKNVISFAIRKVHKPIMGEIVRLVVENGEIKYKRDLRLKTRD